MRLKLFLSPQPLFLWRLSRQLPNHPPYRHQLSQRNMMNQFFLIDQRLFLFINHLPRNGLTDLFAKCLSGVGTAGIIWFLLAGILFLKEEKKSHWFFLPVMLAGGISWVLVEQIIKPLVGRLRPTAEMGAIIVGNRNNDYSFPSGHATIAWAMAVVLSNKEPKLRWAFYILAFFISLSRIYLGKHYPGDVLAGGLLGWSIGKVSLLLDEYLKKTRKQKFREDSR